ncbi:MAG: carboxypeptidase-like regulatory domain-containing protein [Xanthomonadales bacterium]|nr:carboxypeptidase-like regulatory domain-containing protein [Xanthomonadales bacterium]
MLHSALYTLFCNRFAITFGVFLIITAGWNTIVSFNDDGIIKGRVVAADGKPVGGATVTLLNKELLVTVLGSRAMTNEQGQFTFTHHNSHHIWLQAAKDGMGETPRVEFRMYFKGQNLNIETPLSFAENDTKGQ